MTFKDFVTYIVSLVNHEVVPVILGLALVSFLWGVLHYFILHGSDTNEREKARSFMLWGLVGMILLFTVWGFVRIAILGLML